MKTPPMQFLRDWALVIAITAGIAGYFIYVSIPWLDATHAFARQAVSVTQPALIFAMLFLTFCRVDPHSLRPCRWQGWLLLIQGASFAILAAISALVPAGAPRVLFEGAALCMICPTATAAAVVTRKLGGDVAHVTSYTILINLLTSILVPAIVPFLHPNADLDFITAFLLILGKVFPLLLMPLVSAWILRWLLPSWAHKIGNHSDLGFYLWAVALTLALATTTRSVVHSSVGLPTQLMLVLVSLACCALQFWSGKRIGKIYGDETTAGQALGQKNTVLVIWMGYTFFTPVTAVVGGFYSIWHNLYNTYQLRHHK